MHLFTSKYSIGTLAAEPWVRELVPSFSTRSLIRWYSTKKAGRTDRLAVDRGLARKGTGTLDTANGGKVRAFVLALLAQNAHLSALHILVELGESYPKGRITDLIKKAVFRMAGNRARPLIVDEAHWIANKRFVDVLRELHDKSTAPVILIGEKTLPTRLQLFPQVKDRMLVEVEAVPCNESDFRLLHKMYCPAVPLAGDLVRAILDATRGNARRIVVNLVDAEEKASVLSPAELTDGLTLAQFGGDHAIARNTLNARRV